MSTPNLGIDDEDFSLDVIPRVQASFGFSFDEHDLRHVRTFGEFCEAVLAKLPCATVPDCTTQQAFYKLRKVLKNHLPATVIKPTSNLADILPIRGHQRRRLVVAVEAEVGFKLQLLGAANSVVSAGCLLLVIFAITLFFDKYAGALGIALTLTGLYVAGRIGSTIQVKTIREAVEQMSSRHYRQSRRNPATVNRTEIISRLKYIFVHDFGLEITQLTPDALL